MYCAGVWTGSIWGVADVRENTYGVLVSGTSSIVGISCYCNTGLTWLCHEEIAESNGLVLSYVLVQVHS
jgi:hypothetical protein